MFAMACSEMAEASVSAEQCSCPVCLDLLKDPVTIPCGHIYCMSCIQYHWDQEDQKRVYSCPQCRQTFKPRPALGKSSMLAEVLEELKKTELQSGDVECDVCTERKHKAVKSCLVCLNSYCQNHLEQHENLFKRKRHDLIDASGRLQEMICHQHEKILDVYCRTDHRCICLLCMVDEHKNHSTVSAAAERTDKQKHLGFTQTKFQQQIKEREKKLWELKEAVEIYKRSAQTAVEDSERIFTELIQSIVKIRSEVTQMIKDREKTEVSRAEGLLEKLKQEIDDMRRRNAELERLSHTHDNIHFLQSFSSLSVPPGSPNVPSITDDSFDDVGKSVLHLRQKIENICKEEIEKLSGHVRCIHIVPITEYKCRNDFIQYFHRFTLDPNTAHQRLCLSEENTTLNNTHIDQQYPDHPDRFDRYLQVLCRESVTERCYWEVEWSGLCLVSVSVAYKSINRKGWDDDCGFGYNDQSWSLVCSPTSFSFWHNNKQTKLSVVCSSSRIGVYVDHGAGTLSFYSVTDSMSLIHTVQTTFTQPLYPGFRFIFPDTFNIRLKSLFGLVEISTVKMHDIDIQGQEFCK